MRLSVFFQIFRFPTPQDFLNQKLLAAEAAVSAGRADAAVGAQQQFKWETAAAIQMENCRELCCCEIIMPVTPEFSWNETDGVVRMEVKLTSATSFADHDVVATDVYVKVNCPPYLLQLDLFGSVVPEKTEVTVSKPCIKFKFFKQTKVALQSCLPARHASHLLLVQALWGDIKCSASAPDRMQRRLNSLELHASKVDSERKATKDTLENDKDFVFHKQVQLRVMAQLTEELLVLN